MAREIDTGICSTMTDGLYSISSDETRWINRIHKLKEKYPDEVDIVCEPETNEGAIYALVSSDWVKINPPKQVSEEQRLAFIERIHGGKNND